MFPATNADSYNVEEEVFTIAFSKKNPGRIQIKSVPKLVTKKKEVKVKQRQKNDKLGGSVTHWLAFLLPHPLAE